MLALLALAAGTAGGETPLELPDGPAAKVWAGVGAETLPAELPAALVGHLAPEGSAAEWGGTTWSRPETWELWSHWLAEAEAGSVEARAALCLLARAQGRARDAWGHFAALGPEPAWAAAVAAYLLPGVPPGTRIGPGGVPDALPEGVRLAPLVPPTSGRTGPGRVEWRTGTWRGLRIAECAVDVSVTVESTGVQVDLAGVDGRATHLSVRVPTPEGFEDEVAYLDWSRIEDPQGRPLLGRAIPLAIEPDGEVRALYTRTLERRPTLPTGMPDRLSRQVEEGGLVLVLPPDDPERRSIERIAAVLAERLGVPVAVRGRGEPATGWSGTEVELGGGSAREARLAYLCSSIEAFVLRDGARGEVGAPAASDDAGPLPLAAGDRIVLFGDSITHAGHYGTVLEALVGAAWPDLAIEVENAGVSGDTAGDALERLELEVLERAPDLVFVLLGMNDAGYGPHDEERLALYRRGLAEIVGRISREGAATVVVVAPTAYDERAALASPGEAVPDYDATLEHYRAASRAVAAEHGARWIDPAPSMRSWTERLRESDPDATLAPDGVHPDRRGALVVAAGLAGLLPPPPPLVLRLAAPEPGASRRVLELVPDRLPVPVFAEAAPLAEAMGLAGDWNALELDASGLGAGRWRLESGGEVLVRFRTDAAGRVVEREDPNAAASPWHRAAVELLDLLERLRSTVAAGVRDQLYGVKSIADPERRRALRRELLGETLRLARIEIDALRRRVRDRLADRSGTVELVRD